MGISGLLPFLANASRPCHIREFNGCTVAIDAYCWLHKGAFGCAEKLIRGENTNAYVLYCLKYINMMMLHDVKPILVFDGQRLPAKKATEQKRREQRKQARVKARELLRLGKTEEARAQMRGAIDITPKMALALIKECRKMGVDCIVAPYEADAQLAYLNINDYVDVVITEDSDLLVFGCNKVLVKMDNIGNGTLVEATKLNLCMKFRPDNYNFDKFRYMCILSGCDYLESLPGVGLKKALKFVSLTANPDIYNILKKLPSYLKLPSVVVTDDYREAFMLADATFKHQRVFDPVKRQIVPLRSINAGTDISHCKNIGDVINNELAFEVALGNVDPISHERYDDWFPDTPRLKATSIWSKHYKKPVRKPPKLNAPSTKGIEINREMTEQEKLEYDLKLGKQLEIYNVAQHVPNKTKIDDLKPVSIILKHEINIPFKNLKRLSKFERTVVNNDEGLTSRFFTSQSAFGTEPSTSSSLLSGVRDYTRKRKCPEALGRNPESYPSSGEEIPHKRFVRLNPIEEPPKSYVTSDVGTIQKTSSGLDVALAQKMWDDLQRNLELRTVSKKETIMNLLKRDVGMKKSSDVAQSCPSKLEIKQELSKSSTSDDVMKKKKLLKAVKEPPEHFKYSDVETSQKTLLYTAINKYTEGRKSSDAIEEYAYHYKVNNIEVTQPLPLYSVNEHAKQTISNNSGEYIYHYEDTDIEIIQKIPASIIHNDVKGRKSPEVVKGGLVGQDNDTESIMTAQDKGLETEDNQNNGNSSDDLNKNNLVIMEEPGIEINEESVPSNTDTDGKEPLNISEKKDSTIDSMNDDQQAGPSWEENGFTSQDSENSIDLSNVQAEIKPKKGKSPILSTKKKFRKDLMSLASGKKVRPKNQRNLLMMFNHMKKQ